MTLSIDDRVRRLLERFPDIRLAMLFGSTAGGRADRSSDLDLAVSARRPLPPAERMRLIEALADEFGRPVDLIDLTTVGEPLLGVILRTGRRVLCSDTGLYAEAVKRHIFNVADFEPYRKRLLSERRKTWIGN